MYDKNQDILNMYRWKCGYSITPDSAPCPVKFVSKPQLILHLRMVHGIVVKDLELPSQTQNTIAHAIQAAGGTLHEIGCV